MNLALLFYIITVLAELESIAVIIVIFSILMLFLSPVLWATFEDTIDTCQINTKRILSKFLKYIFIPAIIIVFLVPNKNEMYIMTGLVIGERIVKSDKGNELLDKSYTMLLHKIEQASIEEVKEKDSE